MITICRSVLITVIIAIVLSFNVSSPTGEDYIYPVDDVPLMDEISSLNDMQEIVVAVVNDKWELYTITAYCSCVKCCGKNDGITASGVKAVEGITIAASLPFGTNIEIEDIGTRVVQDRGVGENCIDIYMSSHEAALQFGKQKRLIRILTTGEV